MNFNTDPQLFANLAREILATDPPLQTGCQIVEGHVIYKREVIARFTDSEQAASVLLNSGFGQFREAGFTIYRPTA